ncbi:hypothetical protein KFK09_008577 [Dendrobium nobile]|uniref:Prolyl endopeptidase-like n=1 Tax=Dendrobium nobile TaxID=94219 RepID=A0A8T3BLH3_DENNO|nr:hypothetical protein KFK09_008577 [Dendrobium nobile]
MQNRQERLLESLLAFILFEVWFLLTLLLTWMSDAVVDYNLLNGNWNIVQQQNVLLERSKTLYGFFSSVSTKPQNSKGFHVADDADSLNGTWNELTEFYACEYYDVSSGDGVMVPLTVVYSCRHKQEGSPALLHGHGAYGELLDKRKRKFLIEKGIAHKDKLAGWGYSAGGLLDASAINACPDLFQAAILKAPFLYAVNTLLFPILPLNPVDYEGFGYPLDLEDFLAIRKYSPYENIKKDALYPSVLVTSSFNTRFGVWEVAKWVARVREMTIYDPLHPVGLNLTADLVEDSKYLQIKELAKETAFLIRMVADTN